VKSSEPAMQDIPAKESGFLSNGPVFSLLAVYMPLAVLTALVFLLKGILPISPLPLLITGGLSALVSSLYHDFMNGRKSSNIAAHLRSIVIILIISYLFSSLCRRGIPWDERFIPDLSTFLSFIGTVYVWIGVIALKQLFSARKRFEAYTAVYQGEQLYKVLFDDADLLQYIDTAISKTKRNYLIQFFIIIIVLIANEAYEVSLSPALYILLIGVLASGICISGFLGILQQEHYCAAKGMSLSAFDRYRHLLGIGAFSALPIGAAIVLSSDNSILPFSLITTFFNWIFGLLLWLVGRLIILWGLFWGLFFKDSEVEPEPAEWESPFSAMDQLEKSDPWPIWTWLQYGLIALAAIAFGYFMILPLIRRVKAVPGNMPFRRKLVYLFREWFRGIASALAGFFVFLKSDGGIRRLRAAFGADEIRRASGDILGAYSSAKKREMKRNVTLFARLIVWGGEVRKAVWKPVYAPGEYCRVLAAVPPQDATAPQMSDEIVRCGEIFGKALYSAEVLSSTERNEFEALVEKITSAVY
jgi:hypothetical protein